MCRGMPVTRVILRLTLFVCFWIILCGCVVECKSRYRLIAGGENYGRLEVLRENIWGSVCSFNFHVPTTIVACRSLGLETDAMHVKILPSDFLPRAVGKRWIAYVRCAGHEMTLDDCASDEIDEIFPDMNQPCSDHSDDVVIACGDFRYPEEGKLRMTGGTEYSGRLEIFHNQRWGSVCDDFFSKNAAIVACRALGHDSDASKVAIKTYGVTVAEAVLPIWLDNIQCAGNETRLLDCQLGEWGQHDCSHREDVILICATDKMPVSGSMRLADGSEVSGRVMIFHKGVWGSVAYCGLEQPAAKVVCKNLNFQFHGAIIQISQSVHSAGPVWIEHRKCWGHETSLFVCQQTTQTSCIDVSTEAHINCGLQFRLKTRSRGPSEGLLEVHYDDSWGNVCHMGSFTQLAAKVACRTMGLGSAKAAVMSADAFSPLKLEYTKMDGFMCEGSETTLMGCTYNFTAQTSNCKHLVALACTNDAASYVLHGNDGDDLPRGVVQATFAQHTGLICADNLSVNDAIVICRHLGYHDRDQISVVNASDYANVTGIEGLPFVLTSLECLGVESSLTECPAASWLDSTCTSATPAAIQCIKPAPEVIPYRLYGGLTSHSGLVELYKDGSWHGICTQSSGITEARIVCSSVNLKSSNAVRLSTQYFQSSPSLYGVPGQQMILHSGACTSDDHALHQCYRSSWSDTWCEDTKRLAITCESDNTNPLYAWSVKLTEGSRTSGRLQIYYNGSWSTVCYDHNTKLAHVVCYNLGLPLSLAMTFNDPGVTPPQAVSELPIYLKEMWCSGGESHLLECSFKHVSPGQCSHQDDVWIDCLGDQVTATDASPVTAPPESSSNNQALIISGFSVAILLLLVSLFVCQRFHRRRMRTLIHNRNPTLAAALCDRDLLNGGSSSSSDNRSQIFHTGSSSGDYRFFLQVDNSRGLLNMGLESSLSTPSSSSSDSPNTRPRLFRRPILRTTTDYNAEDEPPKYTDIFPTSEEPVPSYDSLFPDGNRHDSDENVPSASTTM